jgi:hypothetical protein
VNRSNVSEVNNLAKTEGSRGTDLRFVGGVLHGHRAFVSYDDHELNAAGIPAGLVENMGGRYRVDAHAAHRAVQQGLVGGTEYRKMRVRLTSPAALLDETIMADKQLSDEQAKARLAEMVGIKLPTLHMFNVKRSSVVSFIAWDMDTLTLDIGFKNGHVYRYFNVDRLLTMEFLAADSLGNFFLEHIKGLFKYVRCDVTEPALP